MAVAVKFVVFWSVPMLATGMVFDTKKLVTFDTNASLSQMWDADVALTRGRRSSKAPLFSFVTCLVSKCSATEYRQFVQQLGHHVKETRLIMNDKHLPNLTKRLEDIVDNGVPGDIFETGIKFGGTSLFMVGVIEAYERTKGLESSRHYHFFDSFEGFQRPAKDSVDSHFNDRLRDWSDSDPTWAAGSRGTDDLTFVTNQFKTIGLLLPRVHFIKGYFEDTMPKLSRSYEQKIAMLRLDGDLYASTAVALQCWYPRVSVGGWVVIDDYDWGEGWSDSGDVQPCKEAVDYYRERHQISEKLNLQKYRPDWQKKHKSAQLPTECQVNGLFDRDHVQKP